MPGDLAQEPENILTGPVYTKLDFSLGKNIPLHQLGENGALEFRAEFFNVLNHPNFAISDTFRQVFAGSANGEAPLPTASRMLCARRPRAVLQFLRFLLWIRSNRRSGSLSS